MIGVTSMLFHQIFDGGNSRSVVTVAGQLPALEEAVLAAAKVFFKDNFIFIWMMAFMINWHAVYEERSSNVSVCTRFTVHAGGFHEN